MAPTHSSHLGDCKPEQATPQDNTADIALSDTCSIMFHLTFHHALTSYCLQSMDILIFWMFRHSDRAFQHLYACKPSVFFFIFSSSRERLSVHMHRASNSPFGEANPLLCVVGRDSQLGCKSRQWNFLTAILSTLALKFKVTLLRL